VFSNSPCQETPKNALKKKGGKKGTYVLFFASWRRCTSFSRFIFLPPLARPREHGRGGVGSACGQRWRQAPGPAARPQAPTGWRGGVFGTWWEFLRAGVGPVAVAQEGKLHADLLFSQNLHMAEALAQTYAGPVRPGQGIICRHSLRLAWLVRH
jgi:hypothetical protein